MAMVPNSTRWQDWANFSLGLWLAVSPWVLDYHGEEAATWNAVAVGLLLALGSHFEVALCDDSIEWLNLGIAGWLLVSPFALGFTARPEVAANAVAVGAMTLVLSASALSLDKEIARLARRAARS